jgi:hypothetical protein
MNGSDFLIKRKNMVKGAIETRVIPLDGAKTVEISALLIYANFTKFMNLPNSTIAQLLKSPEQIADLTDLTLDINEEVNNLIENSNQTKVTPNYYDVVPSPESYIKDTIYLPNGTAIEIKKEKQGKQEIISKRPLNLEKNE